MRNLASRETTINSPLRTRCFIYHFLKTAVFSSQIYALCESFKFCNFQCELGGTFNEKKGLFHFTLIATIPFHLIPIAAPFPPRSQKKKKRLKAKV